MEFGQPSTPAPKAAIEVAHRVLDTDPMGYWESTALTRRIGLHYANTYGLEVQPRRVILTCGASPALLLALVATFPAGSRIAGWLGPVTLVLRNTVKALNMIPVEIACGPGERFQLTARALARLEPAPAGVIIASPANPTGTILPGGAIRHRRCLRRAQDPPRLRRDLSWAELRRSDALDARVRAHGAGRQLLLEILFHGGVETRLARCARAGPGALPRHRRQPLSEPLLAGPARRACRDGLNRGAAGEPCRLSQEP